MDLEIADYERTVKSLHEAVAERDTKVQTLHEEIHCKEQQCASLQKLLGPSSIRFAHAGADIILDVVITYHMFILLLCK